jgi:tetratricopeptide (TPR) repeat protein
MDAEVLIGLERYDEAEEALREGLRRAEATGDTDAASRAMEGLGVVATRRGREDEALTWLRRAAEAADWPDPVERFDLYFGLARIMSGAGDSAEAIALLEHSAARVREEHPDAIATVARYAVLLSYAHSDAGDNAAAATLLAGVLRDGGDEIDGVVAGRVHYALARLHNFTGQFELALGDAKRGLELREQAGDEWGAGDSHLQVAHLLTTLGDAEGAQRHLALSRRCYGSRPSTVDEGYLNVDEARLSLLRGEPEQAVEHARDAIELLSSGAVPGELGMANLVLAQAYQALGEDTRAENGYATAIDLFNRQHGWSHAHAEAYTLYGRFLRQHGRSEAALDAFEHATDLAPSIQAAFGPERSDAGGSSGAGF